MSIHSCKSAKGIGRGMATVQIAIWTVSVIIMLRMSGGSIQSRAYHPPKVGKAYVDSKIL
jgi:hypothetical protein